MGFEWSNCSADAIFDDVVDKQSNLDNLWHYCYQSANPHSSQRYIYLRKAKIN